MKAGFAQIDFTPLEGFMPGEGLPFWARGNARCPLFANAAAFAGEESVILVSVDALSIATDRADDLRARISEKTGVPVSHILLAATHTHTGASSYDWNSGAPGEPLVAKYTDTCIVNAAVQAFENMKDGYALGTAKGVEDRMSFNRDCILDDGRIVSIPGKAAKDHITGYLGTVDHDVHVMRVDGENGAPAAFIVNYANHPDNDNTKRTHFSSDYPGFLRQNLQMIFGREVVVLFLNGACGDVNAYNYKSGVSERYADGSTYMPEEMGKLLTETVCKINREITATDNAPAVKAATRTDTYNLRAPAAWEVEKALATKAQLDAGERIVNSARRVMESTLSYDPTAPATMEMEMVGMRLGDWTILTVPGELYTEIGLAMKAVAPEKKILISEQTNGRVGYIPPDKTLGTTAYGGRYYAGQLGLGTKDKMVSAAKALVKELG
ncbi:MAG: hypothetical protein E7624_06565 [Ruminococcaceae bacterium]|nr:hypothetical protein [Oscillospiraceae bacterium]